MVRSLAAPFPPAGIDARRIAGNAGVIVLHAIVFAVLMLPSGWEAPVAGPRPLPVVIEAYVEPPPPVPTEPPPRPELLRTERPRPLPTPVVATEAPPVDTAPVFPDGEIHVPFEEEAGPPADSFDPGPPAAVQLALDVHPAPRYPPASVRRGEQGLVVLRVHVDARGQPVEVTVERSSGHRELDRAARDTVARRWRFQPARQDGRPVPAWGLVPVRFTLP